MRILFTLFLCCFPVLTHAQDTLRYATLPDSIVITATRYAESAQEVGQRIAVWDADDIARLPVSSFDELLRVTGGVEVFSRSGFGVQSDITIRGGTFNGVLVLVDGVRFNDAQTGHFLSDFPIPLSQIERIEILRGPATVIYGPDALNGVVHVITKAAAQTTVTDGIQASAGTRFGSHNFRALDGDLSYAKAGWQVGGAVTYQVTDGETVEQDAIPVEGPNGIVRTDFERVAHSWFVSKTDGPVSLYARLAMDWRDFNAYHFYTVSSLDFSREETRTVWGQFRLQGSLSGQTDWDVNAVFKQHKDMFNFNPQFTPNEHTSRHFVARGTLKHTVSEALSLSTGLSSWSRDIDSNNLGEHNDYTIGGYVHARYQPVSPLQVYAGVRVDHDKAFGTELTPQINAHYRLGRVGLRANVGRAVRAPNYVEQYINFTRAPQRGRNYGNPALKAEKAWSRELGIDVYLVEDVVLNTTLFQRNTSNLIDFAQLDPIAGQPTLADSVLLAQNIASVETQGIEIDGQVTRRLGQGHVLKLGASYTRLNTDLDEVKAGAVFKYASSHARFIVQSTVQWTSPWFELAVQTLGKEKLDASTYSVTNLRVAVPVRFGTGRQARLSVDVRNAFDRQFTEVLDAPMPGRWILFGVQVRL
ncbi:MAG: TonB-dependent receptor [Bacteroidota bacterium]